MDYHSNNYQWKHLVLAQLNAAISQCKIWSEPWILNLYLPSQFLTPTSILFEHMTFKSKCYFHVWMSYPWRDNFYCCYTQYLFVCLYSLFHFLWKAFAWKTEFCSLHLFLLLLPLKPPELVFQLGRNSPGHHWGQDTAWRAMDWICGGRNNALVRRKICLEVCGS